MVQLVGPDLVSFLIFKKCHEDSWGNYVALWGSFDSFQVERRSETFFLDLWYVSLFVQLDLDINSRVGVTDKCMFLLLVTGK